MSKVVKIFHNMNTKGGNKSGAAGKESAATEGFRSFTELCQDAGLNPGADPGTGPPLDAREAARRDAEEIVSKAKEQAADIEREAYEKGLAKGEQEGLAAGEKKYAEEIAKAKDLLQTLQNQVETVHRQHEQDLLVLIKAMVDRLVNHEVSVNPMVIQACLKKTMEFVVDNSIVKVHLHTDDFNRLKEAGLANPALFEGKSKVQLIEDPTVSLGGCLVSTDFGEIDATLEGCRDKLYEAVDQAFIAALADGSSQGPQT